VEFTLRDSGKVPTRSKIQAHKIREVFDEQLADYWSRDKRLAQVTQAAIKPAVRSKRFQHDVRGQALGGKVGPGPADKFFYVEVQGIKFVPLVTKWRYLRCEVAIRLHRYEGDLHRGGIIEPILT
jgi:hypothetical protein